MARRKGLIVNGKVPEWITGWAAAGILVCGHPEARNNRPSVRFRNADPRACRAELS